VDRDKETIASSDAARGHLNRTHGAKKMCSSLCASAEFWISSNVLNVTNN